MRKSILYLFLFISLIGSNLYAQKSKKKTTRLSVEYIKDHRLVETLNATLRVRDGRYVPLSNAEVEIYNIQDTSRILLQKTSTDEYGRIKYIIEDSEENNINTQRKMNFEVVYEGNKDNSSSKKAISIKRANMALTFIKIDTLRSIEVLVSDKSTAGEINPVKDLRVNFYIKGTFSLYPFGKEKTDEEGRINIDFPVHMPGDTAGVLTIVARIEEDNDYGTIESKGDINWGIPVPIPEIKQRGLGDTDAPLWMVYTLIILFSAVWFHYFYVLYLIIKIKLAKKESTDMRVLG